MRRRAWWRVGPPPPPPPPPHHRRPPRARAVNECDLFFAAPGGALARRYGGGGGALPSHVLLFDELYAEPRARAVLDARGFARRAAYFHEIELTLAAAAPEGRAGQTSGWRWPSWRVRRLLLLTRDLGGRVGSREGAARYLPGN
jgi:hypothetical protein